MTSKIVVNNIEADAGINTVTISGDVTATNVTGTHHGSGANLTNIPAGNLSGTVADARISSLTASKLSGALPAISAANLTSIPAANITGTLPAISGANLTNLPASGKATNLVINGAMTVQQRMDSTTTGGQNLSGIKTVDRFSLTFEGTDNTPTQIPVDVASGTTPYTLGFRRCFKIINGNQTSGAGAGDQMYISHKIEAQNIATSGWNYTSASSNVTLSFWVKSSVAQNFYCYLKAPDGTAQLYPFETGSLSANTWTKITKTIPGNSNLQFDLNALTGLEIAVGLFFGTDRTGSVSLNAWGNWNTSIRVPDYGSANDDWYLTNDATFEYTGVLLEVGDSASDFPHESYAETLLKCYRYFYAHRGMLWGITSAGDHLDLNLTFPVPMRATPSRTQVDGSLLFKNRLNQENSTSASTYSYSGVVSPTGDFWVARPGSGDAWGVSYTTTDTHAVYYHAFEGVDKISYSWEAEL